MRKRAAAHWITGVVFLLTACPVQADVVYTIVNLGVLDGWNSSYGKAVNDSGQVTGNLDEVDPAIAFFWSNGTMIDLGLPSDSYGLGINSSGHVTGITDTSNGPSVFLYDGSSTDILDVSGGGSGINDSGQITGTSNFRGFVYSNGTMTDLGSLPNGLSSTANAINNSGQITGKAETTDNGFNVEHAYLYDNGVMTDLGTLGGPNSEGFAINDSGQVAGVSTAEENGLFFQRAFHHNGVQMQNLGVLPGDQNSAAYGINNSGQIVGVSESFSPETGTMSRAFLYSNGTMTDLNDLIDPSSGWFLFEARDINNNGWITGTGILGEQTFAFLLIPTTTAVPEPSSLAMLSVAGAGLALRRMRRRGNASHEQLPQISHS